MIRRIYDFGANNGDDIPYYLMKSDVVIAVEANPLLCDSIRGRFPREIAEGRLVVVNAVLNVDDAADTVPFYLRTDNHVLSQFPEPTEDRHLYERQMLPAANPVDLIESYGEPWYIKSDIEHYDLPVLHSLFTKGVFPPYISAEIHTVEIFAELLAVGGYRAFKLVNGISVSERYRDCRVETPCGPRTYSFPFHSAGPFGEDIHGPWMMPATIFRVLAIDGLGWKDIHATNVHESEPGYDPPTQFYVNVSVSY